MSDLDTCLLAAFVGGFAAALLLVVAAAYLAAWRGLVRAHGRPHFELRQRRRP